VLVPLALLLLLVLTWVLLDVFSCSSLASWVKNGVLTVLVTNFNHEGLKVNGYTYYSL
jgi:hypothetical protein